MTTYSLPSTSEFVYRSTTKKLMTLFARYLPEAKENDFYELEIASASVTRGFMAHPCDLYFTMERKLRRYYACCFRLYRYPAQRETVIFFSLTLETGRHIGVNQRRAELMQTLLQVLPMSWD